LFIGGYESETFIGGKGLLKVFDEAKKVILELPGLTNFVI